MALDILGPGSALNSVTARPSQTTTYGAVDTWFKPCTTLTSQDGTQLTNDWLNNVLAQLRTAMSSAGVVLNNGDDMLWRVIEVMAPRYAVDTGTVNALVITDTPPVPAYRPGLILAVKVAVTNTGAATIAPDGLTAAPIVHFADSSPIFPGELKAGGVALLIQDDSLNFRLINPVLPEPIYLTASTTFYVNASTGSDTLYDGTAATVSGTHGPFATIQKGVAQVPLYNLNGNYLTISVANGEYSGPVVCPPVNGSGAVVITGNTSTPNDCWVYTTGTDLLSAFNLNNVGGLYAITGFRLYTANGTNVGDPGAGVWAIGGGTTVQLSNMQYGPCFGGHVQAIDSATVTLNGGTDTIEASAAAPRHLFSADGATINVPFTKPTLVIQGSVAITAFIDCLDANVSVLYSSITGASNVTGSKFTASLNGIINTSGSGTSYFPGSTAGNEASGGQYA